MCDAVIVRRIDVANQIYFNSFINYENTEK